MKRLICLFRLLIQNLLRRLSDPVKFARRLGVQIGDNCRLIGNVNFGSEPYLIKIGDHVSITTSQFITHDGGVWVFRADYPSVDAIAPICVGNNVFIGAGCIIMPGVTIGNNVVIGAGSVVTKNLSSDYVYAGIPAKPIKSIKEYWLGLQTRIIETKQLTLDKKREFLKKKFS